MPGAKYISRSHNRKLSKDFNIDATYASIEATCPSSCELRKGGCYSKLSYVGIINSKLNKESENLTALDVAKAEAQAIDQSYGGGKLPKNRCLRIHVSGDSKTIKGSKRINAAVGRWKKRGDKTNLCWSYTHAWQKVHSKHWSNVSMLASIDKVADAKLAREQGYAPAIVVPEFKNKKAFYLNGSDTKWIPCPAQTFEEVTCESCKLCMKSQFLYTNNIGIAFEAHGVQKNIIKKRLKVIM